MSVGIDRVETNQDKTRYTVQLGARENALLGHYRNAYRAQYGEDIAPSVLLEQMISLYLKRDRKFQRWLRAQGVGSGEARAGERGSAPAAASGAQT
jgi:hypothetical protein